MGTILQVPIIRIIIFWCLYWGPLILGNYHLGVWGCRGVGCRGGWEAARSQVVGFAVWGRAWAPHREGHATCTVSGLVLKDPEP